MSVVLPQGWQDYRLEDCVEVLDSLRVPINNAERQSRIEGKPAEQLYPYYGATGQVGVIDDFLFDEELVALGEDGVPFLDPFKPKAYMLRGKTWVNNHAHVLRGLDGIALNKFVFYYLNQFDYQDYVNGGTRLKLTQASMRVIPIPLPPFAEQTRIAAKLDELLAQVDTLKTRIDGIPALLKRFRQSVLAAAVSGRLTEEQRGGAASSPLSQPPLVFSERDQGVVPEGWRWEKLVSLAELESGHTPRKSVPAYWENGDIPWISLQDIRAADGKEISETKHMPTMLGIENSSARLLPKGTVCFSRDISVGFVTIMGRSMATTQHFANWVCKGQLFPKYLMYSFMAGRDHLLQSGQGSTVKTIYMPALKELRLLLPPLAEQTEIVRRVEQLFALADQLEARVKAAQARIDRLTQSILAKAFRGELVPQDPNDQPASVLLERIKAQRAAAPKARRGRRAATLG